ncbi:anti-sigma factor family protein [Paraburkholderia sp. GAS82]|uniref:anti-sigma factor family protein n=1 Tax=Paraburkholderia sp. GAS82 TaxID=3035137 RepID=UPI003D1BF1C8
MKSDDSRHDPPLSETDIQAYADGLLTPERAAHLRQYLGKRPGEARRVAFYGKLNQQIQDAFQPVDEPSPVPAAATGFIHTTAGRWLTRRLQMIRLRPLRATLAVALVLALAVVATSGWMAASRVSQDALDNAAVMALAQAAGENFGAKAAPAAGAVAADPAAPNLVPVGMHLVSRRTLDLGPLARATEYVYLNAQGEPIVLLVASTRPAAAAQSQWSARRVGTLRLLSWTGRQQRYVLAGAANARGLMSAADLLTMR